MVWPISISHCSDFTYLVGVSGYRNTCRVRVQFLKGFVNSVFLVERKVMTHMDDTTYIDGLLAH